jgi:hypothetical protein
MFCEFILRTFPEYNFTSLLELDLRPFYRLPFIPFKLPKLRNFKRFKVWKPFHSYFFLSKKCKKYKARGLSRTQKTRKKILNLGRTGDRFNAL